MGTTKSILKIAKEGNGSLFVRTTKQFKELGWTQGEEVLAYVKDGKVIIEKI